MATFQTNAGQVSQPRVVGRDNLVTIRPSAGATAIVEYTTGTSADIANNAASWRLWPKGNVTTATSDQMNNNGFIRVTAIGGNVSFEIAEQVSSVDSASYRADWQSAIGASGAPTLSGQFVVGGSVKAQMSPDVFATLQFTRTLKAPPYTKSTLGAAIVGVNSATYGPILAGDAIYNIGCDASAHVSSSLKAEIFVAPATASAVQNSTTVFGASHMAYGNPAMATEGSARGGGETSVSYIGIVNDELRKTGPGYDLIHLRAVGGTTVYEHRDDQLPFVLNDPTECVWYNSSPNAYNNALTSGRPGAPYTQASILAAEKAIMAQVAAAKKDVNWVSLMPVLSTGSSGSIPRSGEFAAHVAEMELEAAKYPNVTYHNVYDLLRDPASGVNDPLPNYIQTVDGIHLTSWGARFIGEFIAPRVSAKAANLVKYRSQGPNLCLPFSTTGGTSNANGGTINGAALIPAGWDVSIAANGVTTVTVSKPSADVLRLAITNTAVSTPTVVNLSATNTAAMLAAFAQGDVIQHGFDFATVGTPVGLTRISNSFRVNGATTGSSWRAMARNTTFEPDAVLKYSQAPASGRRWSHPWMIDLAVTEVALIGQFAVTQQGSVTIDISLPVLNKLLAA